MLLKWSDKAIIKSNIRSWTIKQSNSKVQFPTLFCILHYLPICHACINCSRYLKARGGSIRRGAHYSSRALCATLQIDAIYVRTNDVCPHFYIWWEILSWWRYTKTLFLAVGVCFNIIYFYTVNWHLNDYCIECDGTQKFFCTNIIKISFSTSLWKFLKDKMYKHGNN